MARQCLNTCCCCCSLETGGYIIGWINVIFGTLGLVGSILLVIDAINQLSLPGLTPIQQDFYTLVLIIFSIYIVFTIIYITAGALLILGTKNRDHRKIVMMLVIQGIGIGMAFINLATGVGAAQITTSILGALIQFYFFICIFSLYAMIRNENKNKA